MSPDNCDASKEQTAARAKESEELPAMANVEDAHPKPSQYCENQTINSHIPKKTWGVYSCEKKIAKNKKKIAMTNRDSRFVIINKNFNPKKQRLRGSGAMVNPIQRYKQQNSKAACDPINRVATKNKKLQASLPKN